MATLAAIALKIQFHEEKYEKLQVFNICRLPRFVFMMMLREKQLTSNTGTSKTKTVTSNRCYPNSKIETDPKRTPHGVGWGWVTADDDMGCYDPIDPV
jgi:hypothetical protein